MSICGRFATALPYRHIPTKGDALSPQAFVALIGGLLIAAGFASVFVLPDPETQLAGIIHWGLMGLGVLTLIGATVRTKK
jgi:hypothetical protein